MNKYKNELIEVIKNNYDQYADYADYADLNELNIINKYIKIKINNKNNKYKHSNFESLSSKLNQIINSSKEYFYNSIKYEAIKFISYCFNIIIILKARIETEKINIKEELKNSEKMNDNITEVEKQYNDTKSKISSEVEICKNNIKNHINKLRNFVKTSGFKEIFKSTIDKDIKNEIKNLQDSTSNHRKDYQQFGKKKIQNLIEALKLNSLSSEKEEFEKMLSNYKKITNFDIQIRYKYQEYNYFDGSGFWKKFWKWHIGLISNLTHDYEKDRRDECDKYERIMKDRIFELEKQIYTNLTNQCNSFKNDIKNIYSSFNDKLNGLIEHKNEFFNIFKEFKEFIKKSFGYVVIFSNKSQNL